ncbi:MAG TPA: CofH family radical SAM protein [Bacteroidales bacterium]|nr:CofH family radical SAM protein [Bacteroidales bacterium]HPF02670.1 CofH family radical SAM protein [Bacteroidales bacterium]HPJ60503.1 CofH family radical SAM protein [Bacteroidales bacterium]HPR13428.1 CofH family radical SAM protein [Bacteroidales bacterium]HRW84977.1 CofH family radical SAM protein [Bacteroidales bacterium]
MKDIPAYIKDDELKLITEKISACERISPEEAIILFRKADLPLLGVLAGFNRRKFNSNYAFYNKNFHIEPTNICVFNCRFCSYHKPEDDPESWEYTPEQMLEIVKSFDSRDVTEVHITGGVHPSHDIEYYGEVLKMIKAHRPSLHIKAYSAVELDFMISGAAMTIEEGLVYLKECGLDSIPGGGAEIFDEEVRKYISGEKADSERYLLIHETAHKLGIPSNATMLYGHIETYAHRVRHMEQLRDLQDRTGGFNAFIPLKFKKANNKMSFLGEVNLIEDLRNYAVARVFLDNVPHIKAYWPMTGREAAGISLSFGTDDLDGTIEDTTRIYSMAGATDRNPALTTEEICKLIQNAGFIPVERDSIYNPVGKPGDACH